MENIVYNIDDISNTADGILSSSQSKLLCFYGDLGAGKTTLIKALVEKVGASGSTNSPTYGLINEYRDNEGVVTAYHIDCYRLKHVEEGLDIGIEEYLDADCWVFVEWPERIESLLPAKRTEVRLTTIDPMTRKLEMENLSL
jgi:tRNA threonylcarbamoyladenosine biosynthesis protein TsaE